MRMDTDGAAEAIQNARALLKALIASDWKELHVVSDGTEIFIARPGAGANPMQGAPLEMPVIQGQETEAPAEISESIISAPHVATLVDIMEVGTIVTAGQEVATISVLDEMHAVTALTGGTISGHKAQPGALIEYGMAILSIVRAA